LFMIYIVFLHWDLWIPGQIHWLEVLITCSLTVKVSSEVRQDCVVGGLECSFLPLDRGIAQ
jgi:hypothetical protein